ncbi:MAG: hypothetical protein AB7K52_02720 [Phycisphaerales bacterium]
MHRTTTPSTLLLFRRAAAVALLLPLFAGAGCSLVGGLFGGMAESYKRSSTQTIQAEYDGLQGKSFAVVIQADRIIQADYPEVIAKLTIDIAEHLARESGASGYVPGAAVLDYQFNHPRWVTMTPSQLAKEFGVERIIYVELTEYRLNDPGNQYVWQGVAAALVAVAAADSTIPDEFTYQKQIRVKFPDDEGVSPTDMSRAVVNTALVRRLSDRVAWLMYEHEEPYYPEY